MKIDFRCPRPELLHTVEEVVRIFFTFVEFTREKADARLELFLNRQDGYSDAAASFSWNGNHEVTIKEGSHGDEEPEHQLRRMARMAVYRVLIKAQAGPESPWGILTGIRPTKIVHRWLEWNQKTGWILSALGERYGLSPEKARLVLDVALVQRPYLLASGATKSVSIYLGIPFCPTRCAYCSFSSETLSGAADLVQPYLSALHREIEKMAQALRNLAMPVETIYLGGGTPTSLSHLDFADLLGRIQRHFASSFLKEFTVEAGRPDTLDGEKFRAMKITGVDRVSINPQSMHQATLDRIGRRHRVEDVEVCFRTARQMGFLINMDIILGLPGEDLQDVQETLEAIRLLAPENLTAHTLAIKRNSLLNRERDKYPLAQGAEVERMQAASREVSLEMGMHPYYLYRQKNILGHLENTGYSLPGTECLYNINMMEEKQIIIGLGVGAGSKFVDSSGEMTGSLYNPKDIACYLERVDQTVKKKIDKLAAIV